MRKLLCVDLKTRFKLGGLCFVEVCFFPRGGGGGGGEGVRYSHTLPIQVCAAQRSRDFEAADLERGIHFRGVF